MQSASGAQESRSAVQPPSAQTPATQLSPVAQAVLQLPQCLSSLSKSKHLPPHSVKPLLHLHFLPRQRALLQPSLFLSHFLPTFLHPASTRDVPPRSND